MKRPIGMLHTFLLIASMILLGGLGLLFAIAPGAILGADGPVSQRADPRNPPCRECAGAHRDASAGVMVEGRDRSADGSPSVRTS